MQKNRCNMGNRLKELRKEKGMKAQDVCRIMEVSNAVYSYWESDRSEPSLSDAFRLSQIFGVSLEYLITGAFK